MVDRTLSIRMICIARAKEPATVLACGEEHPQSARVGGPIRNRVHVDVWRYACPEVASNILATNSVLDLLPRELALIGMFAVQKRGRYPHLVAN